MHIGSVAILEGPPPSYEALSRMVRAHLPGVPRYRQKVHFVPIALGRPVWVDDPHFNLGYHLRRTALPPPGGDEELRNLVGRVMSQQLDRSKPLWEMWIIEGLSEGRWGFITKLHHCMVDGVSGTELLAVILDSERDPELPDPDDWHPERQPSGAELAVQALARRAVSPYEQLRAVRSAARSPGRAARTAAATVRGMWAMSGVVAPPPPSSLNGPIGPHRRWAWARSQLSDVKRVRGAFGGTVNDVVLTAIAGGFRALLAGARRVHAARRANARAGVRALAGGAWPVQQPRLGDLRQPAGGDRGSGRAARGDARADGSPQALGRSRGGRRPGGSRRVRARDAACARDCAPPRGCRSAASTR